MKLKEARERKGLTQEQLARYLEVTQTAVSRWELGQIPLPKYRRKLVQLLDVSENDIDEFKEQKK